MCLKKGEKEFKTLPQMFGEIVKVLEEINGTLRQLKTISDEVKKMHEVQEEFFRFLMEKGLKTRGV